MASHWAAGRAVDAGFTNVSVMVDGLKGWKAAGQPVATP
jgi:rhodanese-related sulfurtransferase